MGVAGDMGASQGGRTGALGLSTVANSARFPVIPVLREGLESLAALGREPAPEPEEDGAEDPHGAEPATAPRRRDRGRSTWPASPNKFHQ
ncbi:MAG TPA: hypothetical protein VFC52_02890 [Solirubrobacterales bacterium]|nr:hypothetical protein [Solirubrobacterales bacterium]